MPLIEKDVDAIWDGEARERFLFATHCHICKKELNRMVEQTGCCEIIVISVENFVELYISIVI